MVVRDHKPVVIEAIIVVYLSFLQYLAILLNDEPVSISTTYSLNMNSKVTKERTLNAIELDK